MQFDRVRGVITEWRHDGALLAHRGPRLNLWRAPTDNDKGGGGALKEWAKGRLAELQHRTDSVDVETLARGHAVRVRVVSRVAPPVLKFGYRCEYVYTILGSGDVLLDVHATPAGEWPKSIPRIGLQMALPLALERAAWYGLGPGESYPDSRMAQRVDQFRATVDELLTPYVRPQENGNRSDVRWVAFTDLRGRGLMVAGQPTLNFSAHRYTPEDFTRARHVYELTPRAEIILNVDHRQRGLGTASCGPDVWPPYDLKAEEFRFAVRLSPFSCDEASPWELGRKAFEVPG